jgi:hypothetical protein
MVVQRKGSEVVKRFIESGDVRMQHFKIVAVIVLLACTTFLWPFAAKGASSKSERIAFQRSILDRQKQLNPKFKKTRRKKTQYIIVHTSEGGLKTTLRVVSKGKYIRGRYRTSGGHAHYVIDRNGRTYRILDKKYEADHAGLSMWNGKTDVSKVSIGIELVGYHYTKITDKQYRSIGTLIDILQSFYDLDDSAVLTHSQVAYGKPNRWFKKDHRGRKRCAKNFDRTKAGLGPTWRYDPDVKARRLLADSELAMLYYGHRPLSSDRIGSNVITLNNTAWSIAGEDYDASTTLYQFPDGKIVPGDQIEKRIGWNHIPKSTVVLLNQEKSPKAGTNIGPIKTITNGFTAWDFARSDYNKKTTFYFFPQGKVRNGKEISDWDELPDQTKMIIGYRGPYRVTSRRPPIKIAGSRFKKKETLYYFPNNKIVAGDKVKDFRRLPKKILVFLPAKT